MKMVIYKDNKFKFNELFNEKNGLLIRSNVIDSNGKETKEKPLMRSFPELMDIGIMGTCHVKAKYCKTFGITCYQGDIIEDNMDLNFYKEIVEQVKNRVFQIALGGRGDPNKHENFEEILKITRENNIIPNLTTTGIDLTQKEIGLIKEYCRCYCNFFI